MKKLFVSSLVFILLISANIFASADKELRVFTWEGYVEPHEVKAVNKILKEKGYDITVKVISTWAEGPEQMFKVIRSGKADISFLTINYIKMQGDKIAKLLMPIDINSPRIPNYKKLIKTLTNVNIGMYKGKHLYVPYGGGAYGIWANMKKLKEADLPKSVKELWEPKWKGKLALSEGQFQPNLALALLALDKAPFHLNDIADDRNALIEAAKPNSEIQKKMNALYSQCAEFWGAGPAFKDNLYLVASYGIGAAAENKKGGKWKLVSFKEGNTIWLDTINFVKGLSGKKLEAAEIFLNYFIGKAVQERVVNSLGMVAASTLVDKNTLFDENPNFFSEKMFWPPYKKKADNIMKKISDTAMKAR